ncbi:hypothetical protein FACS1894199_09160 [Bacteroidia bacterium]|nr:hypothetical protein FACS1894199_09160 [Bacteroidia bacterium]
MDRAIGGYFELELNQGEHYHKDAIKLNTARNCLEYILRAKHYRKIYIPFYTCEVILEPIEKLKLDYEFYHIDNELNPIFEKGLHADEVFLYTNYYGVKQETVERVATRFKNVIIDSSQAFFSPPLNGIDTFYSARKFFGVPDGAYLYTDTYLNDELEQDTSFERMSHLVKRIEFGAEAGYTDFCVNDQSLECQAIKKMSKLTDTLLTGLNYDAIREKRKNNFNFVHQKLRASNQFTFGRTSLVAPMVYPYWSSQEGLRSKLIANKIFVSTYWKNVLEWVSSEGIEQTFVNELLPLPIDQRWDENDMEKMIKMIGINMLNQQ